MKLIIGILIALFIISGCNQPKIVKTSKKEKTVEQYLHEQDSLEIWTSEWIACSDSNYKFLGGSFIYGTGFFLYEDSIYEFNCSQGYTGAKLQRQINDSLYVEGEKTKEVSYHHGHLFLSYRGLDRDFSRDSIPIPITFGYAKQKVPTKELIYHIQNKIDTMYAYCGDKYFLGLKVSHWMTEEAMESMNWVWEER